MHVSSLIECVSLCEWTLCTFIVLSMGGAIAIHLTADRILSSVIALIAIDVVEGMYVLCL